MKKLTLIGVTSLFVSIGWGQIYVETSCAEVDGASENVAGTIVTEDGIPAFQSIFGGSPLETNKTHTKFFFKNTTGAEIDITVRRMRIDVPVEWTEMFCFSPCTDDHSQGNCADNEIMGMDFTTPVQTLSPDEALDIKPGVVVIDDIGSGLFRYYIMTNNNTVILDSVDLHVNSTVSIDEPQQEIGMSLYPNPVNDQLSISLIEMTDNLTLHIADVSGKIVYENAATDFQTIPTESLKNGVYLITILENETVLQTRRVVVKH